MRLRCDEDKMVAKATYLNDLRALCRFEWEVSTGALVRIALGRTEPL